MRSKLSLIFSILFLDCFSSSAVVPFLPMFFLNTPYCLFPTTTSPNLRYILLGLFTASYPIGQTIGAPFWGYLSDKIGKKKVLLCSYLGHAIGYSLWSVACLHFSIIPLFIGNLIGGFSGINLSITNAIIADEKYDSKRFQFFAIPQIIVGLGFVLGPIAAKMSTHCSFLFSTCTVLSLVNFSLVYLFFKESKIKTTTSQVIKIQWKGFLQCSKDLKLLFVVEFLVLFGWFFFIKNLQPFLIQETKCTTKEILNIYSQYGVWFVIAQSIFFVYAKKTIKLEKILPKILLFSAASIFMFIFSKNYTTATLMTPFFTFAYAWVSPLLTSLISNYGSNQNYGKVMGLQQSIQSIAKILAPLTAGFLLTINTSIIVVFSPIIILFGLITFMLYKKKQATATF
jgi:MFS family permease